MFTHRFLGVRDHVARAERSARLSLRRPRYGAARRRPRGTNLRVGGGEGPLAGGLARDRLGELMGVWGRRGATGVSVR